MSAEQTANRLGGLVTTSTAAPTSAAPQSKPKAAAKPAKAAEPMVGLTVKLSETEFAELEMAMAKNRQKRKQPLIRQLIVDWVAKSS